MANLLRYNAKWLSSSFSRIPFRGFRVTLIPAMYLKSRFVSTAQQNPVMRLISREESSFVFRETSLISGDIIWKSIEENNRKYFITLFFSLSLSLFWSPYLFMSLCSSLNNFFLSLNLFIDGHFFKKILCSPNKSPEFPFHIKKTIWGKILSDLYFFLINGIWRMSWLCVSCITDSKCEGPGGGNQGVPFANLHRCDCKS